MAIRFVEELGLGRLMFLNDQETATDLLYYEAIAKTVVKLIRKSSEAPVTIGVHGDWGAGKSSVLKMIEAAFADDKRVLCLWFNGWTFEGFEDAKTVVIETIVDELRRARPASTKVAEAARKVLKRVDWLKLAHKAGGFAFTAAIGIPTFDQVKSFFDMATAVLAKPQDHLSLEDLKSVAEQAGDFIKKAPEDADHLPEHIHAFRDEFKELLDAADIDQLVVIVDDLDRCLPQTAIATLEAIRLFLFVERTAFVIGADELMIEYAVREHFPDLPPSSGPVRSPRSAASAPRFSGRFWPRSFWPNASIPTSMSRSLGWPQAPTTANRRR
jgi:predicted KAP-like P-loop ATPase